MKNYDAFQMKLHNKPFLIRYYLIKIQFIWMPYAILVILLATFLWSGCGRVVLGAGQKAKRLVLQCINSVSSNPVEGRTKI